DSVHNGVNAEICKRLGVVDTKILAPKSGILKKLVTFCEQKDAENLRNALFNAGAGDISNYSDCSFNIEGVGTFKGNQQSNPTLGQPGIREYANETRIEVIFKTHDERRILTALFQNHPYEEVAYDVYALENKLQHIGSGMVGELSEEFTG